MPADRADIPNKAPGDQSMVGAAALGQSESATEPGSNVGWMQGNIVNPLINGLIEPYHDLSKLVNDKTGHEILPGCDKLAVSTDSSFGASLTRSLAGTVGSLVPYMIAGKFTGAGLARTGRALEGSESLAFLNPGQFTSSLLQHEKSGMVLGAGLLGAAKEPEGDQTRWGNGVGTMVGFLAYEGAGSLWAGWATRPILQRAGAGVLGGIAQTSVQNLISNHDLGSLQDTSIGGITGGVISTILPMAHTAWRVGSGGRAAGANASVEATSGNDRLVAAGNDSHVDTARQVVADVPKQGSRAVKDAISNAEPEQRTDLWNALLDRSKTARQSVSDPVQTMLAESLKFLPEADRLPAWSRLAENPTPNVIHRLGLEIRYSLPVEDGAAALKIGLQKFPDSYYLGEALRDIHHNDLPSVAEAVFKTPEGFSREKMLGQLAGWPWTFDQVPVAERTEILAQTFDVGFKNANFGEQLALQTWWASIPEPRDAKSYEALDTPIRKALVDRFPPADLAKAVFSWTDADLVQRFTEEQPEMVRSMARQQFGVTTSHEIHQIERLLKIWTESHSFSAVADELNVKGRDYDINDGRKVSNLLVAELSRTAGEAERTKILDNLRDRILDEQATRGDIRQARWLAAIMARSHPEAVEKQFLNPISDHLSDHQFDFRARVAKAAMLAASEREMNTPEMQVRLPSLRMPKERTDLTDKQLADLRQLSEDSFRSTRATRGLIGEGPLGVLMPSVLGKFELDGGIVGRPQHEFHQYPVHAHSLLLSHWLQRDRNFSQLPEKVQTDGYWTALLHDTGKKAGVVDPHHEWLSGSLSWGVLRTLDYSPVRIQRISNLIARHSELSFSPNTKVSKMFEDDPRRLDDLAAHYANPNHVELLRRFNEADIKAINKKASLFTDDVASELDLISEKASKRVAELTRHSVPILTTNLPARFSLVSMDQPYAVFGHVSHNLKGSFLDQLPMVESPQNSMSVSLLTESNRRFYSSISPDLVALVAGPTEQISQAYRSNLGTGRQVGWDKHVDLLRDWSSPENRKAREFAEEIDAKVREAGVLPLPGELGALRNLRESLALYDTLDELVSEQGADSPYVKGQMEVIKAMTNNRNGNPNHEHNEAKMNNPTLVGFGILRQGRQVIFENMSNEAMSQMLGNGPRPDWLATSTARGETSRPVFIPESVWRNAQSRDLPLVVLDP